MSRATVGVLTYSPTPFRRVAATVPYESKRANVRATESGVAPRGGSSSTLMENVMSSSVLVKPCREGVVRPTPLQTQHQNMA
jgi:hypothetical protein